MHYALAVTDICGYDYVQRLVLVVDGKTGYTPFCQFDRIQLDESPPHSVAHLRPRPSYIPG